MTITRPIGSASSAFVHCLVATCCFAIGCSKKDTGTQAAASGSATTAATPAACPAGQLAMEGPGICVQAADGYVKPLDMSNSKSKDSGNLNVSYSADGTVGGKFVATFTVTYNAPLASPPSWKYLEDDAANYCDTKPTLEDIAGGKGKYFQCMSKKLEGHSYAKSKIITDKNVIDCSSQSEKKPEVDTVCKSLKQL